MSDGRDAKSELPSKSNENALELKSGKKSVEEAFYLSNIVGDYQEPAEAIRLHWSVKTNNHVRDVSLQEDKMRSKKRNYSKQWRD